MGKVLEGDSAHVVPLLVELLNLGQPSPINLQGGDPVGRLVAHVLHGLEPVPVGFQQDVQRAPAVQVFGAAHHHFRLDRFRAGFEQAFPFAFVG